MSEHPAFVNILITAATVLFSIRGFYQPGFVDACLLDSWRVTGAREYRRLLSSALVHRDWIHLLVNMIGLISFGSSLEQRYGPLWFLLFYGLSIVGGNLLSLYAHRGEAHRSLGASGGICGILFAHVILFPGGSLLVFPIPFPVPTWLFAILFLAIAGAGLTRGWGNIGHAAHLGGALAGLALVPLVNPQAIIRSPLLYGVLVFLGLGLACLACGAWRFNLRDMWNHFQRRNQGQRRRRDQAEMDALLDKISTGGLQSLSDQERERLGELAERKKADDAADEAQRSEHWFKYRR